VKTVITQAMSRFIIIERRLNPILITANNAHAPHLLSFLMGEHFTTLLRPDLEKLNLMCVQQERCQKLTERFY